MLRSPQTQEISSTISLAVKTAVEITFAQVFGETPQYQAGSTILPTGPCVAGIISFMGDVHWTLTWILSAEVAPLLAEKMTGLEIPFDSLDMGDVAGEMVNVLAGEVVLQLERRRIKAQMSLPTVAKGSLLEFLPEQKLNVEQLNFTSSYGGFWLRVVTPVSSASMAKLARV